MPVAEGFMNSTHFGSLGISIAPPEASGKWMRLKAVFSQGSEFHGT